MKYFIVIDMQNDFISMALGTPEAQKIVPLVVDKIKELEKEGYSIVCTLDTHNEDYLETQEGKNLPVPHCIFGTDGWKLDSRIKEVTANGRYVGKETFGYYGWKDFLFEEPEEIILCGLCTDICVISNALLLKTFFPEVEIKVLKDLCAGVTPETHEAALKIMEMTQMTLV